jgi:hypothetical protein
MNYDIHLYALVYACDLQLLHSSVAPTNKYLIRDTALQLYIMPAVCVFRINDFICVETIIFFVGLEFCKFTGLCISHRFGMTVSTDK